MPVAPIRNNAQHQPLTTVLRNIILEYPAGGGVLRELCQNADDAGATRIEFVLDTNSYEKENILHPGLAGYQGPALLAFNDSTFSDTDFESLSRIGDSAKAKDLNATGKFGRGFNSVYNWSDMPSILSGESLLILDPHFTWSREVSEADPGGPVYDFVGAFHEPEMRNQLSAFGSILKDFGSRFEGTIIRLPLRTEAQAAQSDIVPGKSTSEANILDVFKKSCTELVESLLFLRNVHTITFRINENIYARAKSTTHASHREAKDIINEGYSKVFVEQEKDLCETDFLTEISVYRGEVTDGYKTGKEEKFRYAISHYLGKGPDDDSLQEWARSQKLFPWVAIATPLEGGANFSGRLFSTLPLPIHTKHPVHIHGMFSITPDRSNIHSGGDWTMSENSGTGLGARWNTWLFQKCVPSIWIRNLEFLDRMSEDKEARFTGWDFWPAGTQGAGEGLWMGVLGTIFQQVVKENLKLLPTVCGNAGAREDILFTLKIEEKYRNALQHARSPISFPPADRIPELAGLGIEALGLIQLSPVTARTSLSKLRNFLGDLVLELRMDLLEYVLLDKDYESIGSCHAPLLPTPDGRFHGFSNTDGSRLYFPQTKEEAELFKESSIIIDAKKLNVETEKQMKSDIKKLDRYTAVSIWGVPDAVSYCKKYIFSSVESKDQNVIARPGFNDFVNRFWEWIQINNTAQLTAEPRLLNGLWLIPAIGDRYHKILDGKSSVLDISGHKLHSKFFRDAASRLFSCYGLLYPLYDSKGFTPATTNMLRTRRYIQDCGDFSASAEWLVNNRTNFVDMLSDEERTDLIHRLGILSIGALGNKGNGQIVGKLKLFRETATVETPKRPWISLDSVRDGYSVNYIGVKDVPVDLSAPNTIFVDISDKNSEDLIQTLRLAHCPSLQEILNTYVIPNITNTEDSTIRATLVEFALKRLDLLSKESTATLSKAEIVPVGTARAIFRRPKDTVSMELAPYFFSGENRIPNKDFYTRHHSVLVVLGMVERLSEDVVLERIGAYSQLDHPLKEVGEKAKRLIERYGSITKLPEEYLALRWLPAHFPGEVDKLYDARECRDQNFETLAKYAMPLMTIQVPKCWMQALGWDKPLPKSQILKQLDGAVEERDTEALRHLFLRGGENLMGDCISELQERQWIPDTLGTKYYRPADIFLDEFSCFSPYLSTIAHDFKVSKSKVFLEKLGVNKEPSFSQLKELQDNLAAKGDLKETDLEVALCIVKEVGKRFAGKDLTEFKAPDSSGSLRLLRDLTAGGPGPELKYLTASGPEPEETKRAILHPGVPQVTIEQLRLPSFHDRLLEFLSDPDFDDDFAQRESPLTVIKDTLRRYKPSSTFDEYLANAEDCRSATEVSWVLDHSESYEGKRLLVEKLQEVQGPALFCCNDGQFTKKDFKAVIDIGVGSKQEDYAKIGKFGRGALTMYHWTIVPCLISGDSFVIFDPERKYLPVHPITGRPRAGMKLKLKDVRLKYPDQLRPFEGIFGFRFNKHETSFPGTIFRFPLTSAYTRSSISSSNIDPGKTPGQYLREYFEHAMDSLLFLEKITTISFREIIPPSDLKPGSVRGESSNKLVWKVSSEKVEISENPKIKELIIKGDDKRSEELKSTSNKWCVISGGRDGGDLPTKSLVKIQIKERLQARYGLAASISKTADLRGRNYMSLPLVMPDTMEIPVHVDANLVIQSNRQSIPLADSEIEEGSEWNKWIFEKCVAPLYLILVNHLMQAGVNGYRYWPPYPSATTDAISRVISTAFWEKVVELPYRLFPPETLHTNGIPKNLEFEAATFNLLDSPSREFFIDLLLRFGLHDIVSPSQKIRDSLRTYNPEPMKLVSPEYILALSRSPKYKDRLFQIWKEKYQHDMDFLNTLLLFIINGVAPESLIGCVLLPLLDGNLGQFLSKKTATVTNFLIAKTPDERVILDVSPNLVAHPDLNPSVIKALLAMDNLNIANFQFEDIPQLHATMGDRSTDYRKSWIRKVWSYFENCIRESPEKQEEYLRVLDGIPVYFGTPVGQPDTHTVFFSPAELSASLIPAIIKQSGLTYSQSSVLESFNGLTLLDPSAFPQSQLPSELMSNISGILGIYRLLKSIKILADKLPIEEYIIKTLQADKLEVLRELLDPTVMGSLRKSYPESMEYLKQLPIWPSEAGKLSSYKPATKAMLAPDYSISFTSLTKNDPFIKASVANTYSSELNSLGVRKMSFDALLRDHVHSGQTIGSDKIPSYKSFLLSLYRSNAGAFSQHPLAIDQNGQHRMPNSLYDITNNIFHAAFRGMKTHFLHPDLQDLHIWQNAGLRKEITDQHYYLECVRSIEQRQKASSPIEDDQLVTDARTVFEYLSWDDQKMQSWNSNTWNILYTIPVAPAQREFGNSLEYRKPQMRNVLRNSNFTTLSAAVIPEHVNIAWSQCPTLKHKLGSFVLSCIHNNGVPSAETVLKHLIFLSENYLTVAQQEIPAYISDVKACYEHLQSRISSLPLPDRKAKIWLNVEATDIALMSQSTFRDSWTCSELLCSGLKSDSSQIQYVRSFLIPFPSLLDHYRVEKYFPSEEIEPPTPSTEYSAVMLSDFRRLRQEGKLLDITLDVENTNIKAHRIILATVSKYWERMLTGSFRETSEGMIPLPELKAKTVTAVLEYMYTGEVLGINKSADPSDTLQDLMYQLEVSDLWDLDGLKGKLQYQICRKDLELIRPETAQRILEYAKDAKATSLGDRESGECSKLNELFGKPLFNLSIRK